MTIILVMITPRSLADTKAHLAECVAAAEAGQPVVVSRHGRPVVAIVPMADFERLQRLRGEDPQAGLAGLVDAFAGDQDFVDESQRRVAERGPGRALPDWDVQG